MSGYETPARKLVGPLAIAFVPSRARVVAYVASRLSEASAFISGLSTTTRQELRATQSRVFAFSRTRGLMRLPARDTNWPSISAVSV